VKPPTEAQEARTLVAYLRVRGYRFTHVANETGSGRGARFQGIRNKQQGTSKGFPDYLVIVNNRLVAIELKRTKGSSTSQEQKDWIEALNNAGVDAVICKGAEEAINYIEGVKRNWLPESS
jgi:hypothetical protein